MGEGAGAGTGAGCGITEAEFVVPPQLISRTVKNMAGIRAHALSLLDIRDAVWQYILASEPARSGASAAAQKTGELV